MSNPTHPTKFLRRGLAAACVLLAGLAAVPAAHADPAQSGTYELDKNHAKILFGYVHAGFSVQYGMMVSIEGRLELNAEDPAKSSVSVEASTDSLSTGIPQLDQHIREKILEAQVHPKASFKSTSIERTGPANAKIHGDLTLHGVTKPIVLDAKLVGAGSNPMNRKTVAGFSATGTFSRSAFGMAAFPKAAADEVELILSAEFDKIQ